MAAVGSTQAVAEAGQGLRAAGWATTDLGADPAPFHTSLLLQNGQNLGVVSNRPEYWVVSTTTYVYDHPLPGFQKQALEEVTATMGVES